MRLKRFAFFYTLIFIMTALTPGISGYGEGEDSLEELRIAYQPKKFSGIEPKDAEVATNIWMGKISATKDLLYRPHTLIYEDLEDMIRDLNEQKIDVINLNAVDYIRIMDRVRLKPSILGVSGEEVEEEYLFLVNKAAGIKELSQLKGKRMLIETGRAGQAPELWLDTLLLSDGQVEMDTFFREAKRVYKASSAVLPVFFRQADACIVRRGGYLTIVEMNPQVGNDTVVLFSSPPFIGDITSFREDFSEKNRRKCVAVACDLHNTPEGRQMLMLFRTTKLIPFEPKYLENVKALVEEYDRLKK